MSANAVQAALADAGLGREDLQMLSAATTQGDYLVPGHASAVHGELGGAALELASFQSVCASSVMALTLVGRSSPVSVTMARRTGARAASAVTTRPASTASA